ncbi:ubiquitin specific protease 14 [Rhynchophorus ferrugineus]|uniref:Ubiquitin carboxyl-terminal hydrolase n=1 Tax=Rhynchophorus ferrugineus TaxID=354439 RepID=A0A834M9G8_RHYFE|nr:hypothetical protein GWI33_015683 [Rhynchophorus ferrugineus]
MPVYKVKVKWGKDTFPVEVNTDDSPVLFKAQIFTLTGVLPERQKVMIKGVTLKDDDWTNFKLKDNATLLLMGSKEEDLPKEPVEKTVFVEDMNESELATAYDLPAGLKNLGNTCYLNATVQCLKTVPELKEAIQSYQEGSAVVAGAPIPDAITSALKDLFSLMDKETTTVPVRLLRVLHMGFPRFAEQSEHGGYAQQDANEVWTELVRMLQQKLPPKIENGSNSGKYKSIIDQYFGGTFDVELKCDETEEESITHSNEQFLQLSCFISQELRYMHSGLKSKMQEKITKKSLTLDRDAVYTKTSKISRLPAYLTIQFVRFYFKEKESINAKILKDVKFPMEFDAFDLCTPKLQEKLSDARNKFKEWEDAQIGVVKEKNKGDCNKQDEKKYAPYSFEDDLGSNNSGYYTLQAVLTHKGRSSSSGHYVGWIRLSGDKWVKCDDDEVSPVTMEEILRLSGGGDWHCAYVLLYGPRLLEITQKDEKMVTE